MAQAVEGKQLFVGNLPYSASWQDLKDLFSTIGHVVRADVAQHANSGRSKGFGTVLFSTEQEATNAIESLNGHDWMNRKIEVRLDNKNAGASTAHASEGAKELFVGNLPFTTSWQDLKDMFKQYGTVVRAEVATGANGRSKGFGTIVMSTAEEAKQAKENMQGYELQGRSLEVRYDKKSGEHAPIRQAPAFLPPSGNVAGRQLYVGNLPYSIQWQELKDLFREAGHVVRADVMMDHNGRSRGFGQVVMSTEQEAQDAIERINGAEIQGRVIEVREDKFAAETAQFHQVFVGNLPFSMRWQELKDVFKEAGLNPTHADVMLEGGSSRSKGCGVVRFASQQEADQAITQINGLEVSGRQLVVRQDKFA